MSVILGFHMGHDASAALIVDGRIVAGVAEERLQRVKMYRGFPQRAMQEVMRLGGVTPKDVDHIALATQETFKLLGALEVKKRLSQGVSQKLQRNRILFDRVREYFTGGTRDRLQRGDDADEAEGLLRDHLRDMGLDPQRLRIYDHHLCHAASAFYCSPFPDAWVFTVDGRGDGVCASAGHGEGWGLSSLVRVPDLHSIGMFYSAITCYLGYAPNRHEGKITGLAAFGDPHALYAEMRRLFHVMPEERSIALKMADYRPPASLDELDLLLKRLPLTLKDRINLFAQRDFDAMLYGANWYAMLRTIGELSDGHTREDVAAAAQKVVEDVLVEWVGHFVTPDRPRPVTLAGGVFANVRVNQMIAAIPGVENVYVQPAMGDSGIPLGAALLAHVETMQETGQRLNMTDIAGDEGPRSTRLPHVYLGAAYSSTEIETALAASGLNWRRSTNVAQETARYIHQGYIVGRFAGGMEWGPRALGNRSILIRPTDHRINDSVNQRLKRTEFMPFAPSMLAEAAPDYLIGWSPDDIAAEFMTITYDIRPEQRSAIEAVVHVDGTARPQVVRPEINAGYHAVLQAYQNLSGLGAVVNTSFNMHEEPIVESPQDAIRSLQCGCVDVLVLEDYICEAPKMEEPAQT